MVDIAEIYHKTQPDFEELDRLPVVKIVKEWQLNGISHIYQLCPVAPTFLPHSVEVFVLLSAWVIYGSKLYILASTLNYFVYK